MKFRKKPVVIDAIQFTGLNREKIEKFVGEPLTYQILDTNTNNVDLEALHIKTLEGTHLAKPNDWIIRGVKGEFYPCKPDIFKETYDKVE